jgi:hypothetical protein
MKKISAILLVVFGIFAFGSFAFAKDDLKIDIERVFKEYLLDSEKKIELKKVYLEDLENGICGWRLVHLEGLSILRIRFQGIDEIKSDADKIYVRVEFENDEIFGIADISEDRGNPFLTIRYEDRKEEPKSITIVVNGKPVKMKLSQEWGVEKMSERIKKEIKIIEEEIPLDFQE